MILGYSNRQLVTMAPSWIFFFSSAGIFWVLFTMVLSGHPSNFPDNFSFLHFFPGWHDFWANAPGLTVKHTVMDTVSRTGQTLLQTVCLPRLCLYSSLPVWQRVWSCPWLCFSADLSLCLPHLSVSVLRSCWCLCPIWWVLQFQAMSNTGPPCPPAHPP